ncbi:TPA: mannonate dehydratase [Bacillus cytotoxicus]|uniref:mannonate dehydratase n=1 Tax=Bacillus cytotoxicus TaxID=580165 RepID=UPI000B9735A8|nr:mannonate dehydratase [Bacillus cytotoxicus]AWC30893.1 mannonate dehydratase [Bacillus cytotoxicus]HDR7293622.1 mannonate dehydratase [Bacillus cytotoxicus]HDR7880023.1 mannonate dehydratase [Bacillus cytotoxicus]
MKMTMRHYGEKDDPVKIEYIRQTPGITGVVGALFDVPVGEVWPMDKIQAMKDYVVKHRLELEVIESVNIHEDIKLGLSTRDKYIENYKETVRRLAKIGIKVICYNFMPVFDWMKTEMDYSLEDGSTTMAFFLKGVQKSPEEVAREVISKNKNTILPGWEPERLAHVTKLIEHYQGITEDDLRINLKYFLEQVIPVCEEVDIKMAIHPDDPPYSIFGLPRIVKNRDDLNFICNMVDSPYNGITLCTGSVGEDPENDVVSIVAEFTKRGRIPFAHVRNVKFIGNGKDCYESAHYSPCGSLDLFRIMEALYDNGFDGYIRPGHGRMIWGETGRPGYGLYDRALGAMYLTGIWESLEKRGK